MGYFFQSVEFYVLATLVAAVIVGVIARPSSRGEARQHLLAGNLSNKHQHSWSDNITSQASISMNVRNDGALIIEREGIVGVSTSGAVSLAVTIIGFDISIEERIVTGNPIDDPIDTATFVLDFLAPDRYHLKYNSTTTSSFATTTIIIRPGFKKSIPLLK